LNLWWWQGLLLGLVQGLTEFLPISSSGHLVLAERVVGYVPQGLFFEIAVHVATLLSVFIAYRVRIAELLRGLFSGTREAWSYTGLLVLGSIPAALVGLLFRDWFEASFHSMTALGWQFLATAALLWSTPFATARATATRITPVQALAIGAAQAFAILPAISRSGATIAVALWLGVAAVPAAEFSFLLSIIAIAGSGLLEARHLAVTPGLITPGLVWAFLAALVSGVVAIRFLIRLLERQRFHAFAPYCALLGVLCLIWFGWLGRG
jgi:undecaprenyl-diphosphatase